MPQDQKYGRYSPRPDWEDERNRDYGFGRDDWRGESHRYRGNRYEDQGGQSSQDQRQDRGYQGTLRAGDYGRYEEEEGRTYPERYRDEEYGGSDRGSGSRKREYPGYGGGYRAGYGQQDYGASRSRGYSSGQSTGYRGTGSGYSNYGQAGEQAGGFGTYTQDYDRKYGSGSTGGRSPSGYGGRQQRDYGNGERDWWDRATDEVSSWFGDEDAERRRNMDQHRGRGPKNYSRSDERIREDVSDRLTDDPLVDASEIDVSVSSQEVTLSGTVHTRQQRRLAEDCAESVSGVKHVQNNLRVKQPSWSSGQSGSSTTGGQSSFGSGGTTTM